jgi:secreted trypsin-like serine protease
MKHSELFLSLSAFSFAAGTGCISGADELESAQLEIVNGLVDTGHPSVVRVLLTADTSPTAPACTGVLVTSSMVLTAGHCVQSKLSYRIDFGGGSGFYGTARVHPSYPAVDMAVISTLDKVGRPFHARLATGVAAGTPIVLSGYGQVAANAPQDGIKRYGTNVVDMVDASYLYFDTALTSPPGTESATCFGDSGGPAFAGGFDSNCVVGITKGQLSVSGGTACDATNGAWIHTRTDNQLTWIQSVSRDPIVTCN